MNNHEPMRNMDCVLAGLSERIDTLHSASLSSYRQSIEKAFECGRVLAEAKALLDHGQWLLWLKANTKVDPRTAQRWMRFAKNADAVLARCATSADLTFADIDRDLSIATAMSDGVASDLRDFAEKVASLRNGFGVYADIIETERRLLEGVTGRRKRRPGAREAPARIAYEQYQDEAHGSLWQAVASHLVECWMAHAEWFDEDEFDAALLGIKTEYVNQCRRTQLSPGDRRAYAYSLIFAEDTASERIDCPPYATSDPPPTRRTAANT